MCYACGVEDGFEKQGRIKICRFCKVKFLKKIPKKPRAVFSFQGIPDDLGRRMFTIDWVNKLTGRIRSQVFFADPKKHKDDFKKMGYRVVEQPFLNMKEELENTLKDKVKI